MNFTRTLLTSSSKLDGEIGNSSDEAQLPICLREITHNDKDLLINGRPVNLRLTHDGGDFPLTGYPAMDVASWKKIIQTCKDYGLNGMRFHSWCPPKPRLKPPTNSVFIYNRNAACGQISAARR